jgi:hypothetical protein
MKIPMPWGLPPIYAADVLRLCVPVGLFVLLYVVTP